MKEKPTLTGTTYEGTPKEIVVRISEEIARLLEQSNRPTNGLTALALIHVAACMIRAGNDALKSGDSAMGKMPSFASALGTLVHGLLSSGWTVEELNAFDKDFVQIIESLGGVRLPKGAKSDTPVMAPMSPHTH